MPRAVRPRRRRSHPASTGALPDCECQRTAQGIPERTLQLHALVPRFERGVDLPLVESESADVVERRREPQAVADRPIHSRLSSVCARALRKSPARPRACPPPSTPTPEPASGPGQRGRAHACSHDRPSAAWPRKYQYRCRAAAEQGIARPVLQRPREEPRAIVVLAIEHREPECLPGPRQLGRGFPRAAMRGGRRARAFDGLPLEFLLRAARRRTPGSSPRMASLGLHRDRPRLVTRADLRATARLGGGVGRADAVHPPEPAARRERAECREDASLLEVEELVAPLDGCAERSAGGPVHRRVRRPGSRIAPESLQDGRRGKVPSSGGRELECERQPVEPTADLGHVLSVLGRQRERAVGGACPLHEQRHRLRASDLGVCRGRQRTSSGETYARSPAMASGRRLARAPPSRCPRQQRAETQAPA